MDDGDGTTNLDAEERDTNLWKSYLYQVQQSTPKPIQISCQHQPANVPTHYGPEFHGLMSREKADSRLRSEPDGAYLIRESPRQLGSYSLSMRFNSEMKHYRLFYNGQHYVGDKRFESMDDLVQDGLITMHMECQAGSYIAKMMYQEPIYDRVTKRDKVNAAAAVPRSSGKSKKAPLPQQLDEIDRGDPVERLSEVVDPVCYVPVQQLQEKERRSPRTGVENATSRISADNTLPGRGSAETIIESPTTQSKLKTIKTALTQDLPSLPTESPNYKKAHPFKISSFKGLHWCQYCGNFLWGLVSQGMKCVECGLIVHKQCSLLMPRDCKPDRKSIKRVYGIDLTTLVKAYNTSIPFVVEVCVKEIENRGLHHEGIYRVSGFSDEIEEVRALLERDAGDASRIDLSGYKDVNTISGALKLYFRQLPIPLVTFDAYPHFISSAALEENKERVESLKMALQSLPPAHLQTLRFFLGHLVRVTQLSSQNKMGSTNLGVVFGPTLLRSVGPESLMTLGELPTQRLVIELLIDNYSVLFHS